MNVEFNERREEFTLQLQGQEVRCRLVAGYGMEDGQELLIFTTGRRDRWGRIKLQAGILTGEDLRPIQTREEKALVDQVLLTIELAMRGWDVTEEGEPG